ncbi:MAG: imidazole glycerol phosphate synthase cyclase subunit, partial [Firmicutes bacterium]|nr:imidazole glycerol phosphate synthase cyclase subunit [Bacillota bacterium]
GGIRSVADAQKIIDAGASKISINSAAVLNPGLISECAKALGSARVVCAIDAKLGVRGQGSWVREERTDNSNPIPNPESRIPSPEQKWTVYINGGKKDTGIDAVEWARKAEALGAGEILLTSIDRDGVRNGYDIPLTRAVVDAVKIPVTASGGAGCKEDFLAALTEGGAASALGASVFHFREIKIGELKKYLRESGVCVNDK